MVNIPGNIRKICVHTGNILNLNEVKKNAGQNSSEELVESLKIVLNTWKPSSTNIDSCLVVKSDDDTIKVPSVELSELRSSVKIFITSGKKEALEEAIANLFTSLETDNLDSVVIAYTSASSSQSDRLKEIQHLWGVLEQHVNTGKMRRIGISDVDTELFISLYNSALVKPSIVQINLASCCVVPPLLQEFCKQHDIQLLTHNDPLEILPSEALQGIFPGETVPRVDWTARFQVHVKCRGVLATKGYITSIFLNHG